MTFFSIIHDKKTRKSSILVCLLLLIPAFAQAFSAYSNSELDQLEREFIQQINQSNQVIRDPLANQYINHLAKRLAQHGDLKQPYFFLIKSNEINAFAGPGGYIGVNSQLILASESESELAAVMAHEMSHVRQHHLYRMLEHQKQMRVPMMASLLASLALGVINPALASGALMGSMTGFAQDNINFVRSNEKEADRIGIDMLIKSGLDPRGMAGFFKKMQQSARYYYTDNIPAILRTHPLDEDRIAEAENRSLHLAKKDTPDSLDYRLFKELIHVAVEADPKNLLHEHAPKTPHEKMAYEYGQALALLKMNQNQAAIARLTPLLANDPNQLFFSLAMAQAEAGASQTERALARLTELQANYPMHYAIVMQYANTLLDANLSERATSVLLKASRVYPQDLPLCELLARAQSASKRKGYAYFTLAQCYVLQGAKRDAVRTLKLAKTLANHDAMLQARINAKIDELTEDQNKF